MQSLAGICAPTWMTTLWVAKQLCDYLAKVVFKDLAESYAIFNKYKATGTLLFLIISTDLVDSDVSPRVVIGYYFMYKKLNTKELNKVSYKKVLFRFIKLYIKDTGKP